ncbi:hypothetical protein V2J09_023865 [Rumex salicifolius]
MAIDIVDAASGTSPSPSHSSQQRHFYLAVDRIQFKMETLIDLLGVVGRRSGLPVILCCSSRDELDAVCTAVSSLPYISLGSLYSDLSEAERTTILENFRQIISEWHQIVHVQSENTTEKYDEKSHMIVVTDACLPVVSSGESPLSAPVLINYELPLKKETYSRRTGTCLAADGIVINMVVGGEVVALKNIEETSNLVIAEMPIQDIKITSPASLPYSNTKGKASL